MESMKVREALDYLPGDLVAVDDESFRGMLGRMEDTKLSRKGGFLLYQIRFIDSNGATIIKLAMPQEMRFLSHAKSEH